MNKLIPTIGESGFYDLLEPFALPQNSIYVCKAIRTISEYISLNEDPFKQFYEPKGIDIEVFNSHMQLDIEIISLLGEGGHWVHVPSTHIRSYPNMNGVPYRTISLVVQLPAFSTEQKFDHINTQIQDLVLETLGVGSQVTPVVTSKPVLVDSDEHLRLTTERRLVSNGTTNRSQVNFWRSSYESLKRQYDILVNHFN